MNSAESQRTPRRFSSKQLGSEGVSCKCSAKQEPCNQRNQKRPSSLRGGLRLEHAQARVQPECCHKQKHNVRNIHPLIAKSCRNNPSRSKKEDQRNENCRRFLIVQFVQFRSRNSCGDGQHDPNGASHLFRRIPSFGFRDASVRHGKQKRRGGQKPIDP